MKVAGELVLKGSMPSSEVEVAVGEGTAGLETSLDSLDVK